MSDATPDHVSVQSDAPAGKHSKWDWFFAYGAALLVGSACLCLLDAVAVVIRKPVPWVAGLGASVLFYVIVFTVFLLPIWLIGWPVAFGLRHLAGRLLGERLIASVMAGCIAGIALGWLIFGWMYRLHFPESVSEIVIALLAGAAGGWTWWGVENRLRRARAAKAAAKTISTADQNP